MSKFLVNSAEELALSSRGYRLLRKIGEGSYARVFLAEYRSTTSGGNVGGGGAAVKDDAQSNKTRQLACKLIDTENAPRDFVKKFLPRELDILIKIRHPHIVQIYSVFEIKSKYYILMRYAESGDLLDYILKKGAMSESQTRIWFRQLSLAVQYLHEMDIAHRDLKCENVLITSNFNIKLADFGFGRYVIDGTGKSLTSETYCGSLSYAAPDILKGLPYHPKIADLWSLGIILYIMLNKAMPFDDTNVKRLYEQQMNKRWKFRSKVIDVLSGKVKRTVEHLLEPDVVKRWRIEQLLSSEWFAMDARLLQLSAAEQAAMLHAQTQRKKYLVSLNNQANTNNNKKTPVNNKNNTKDEVTVLKDLKRTSSADNKTIYMSSVPTIVE